MLKILAPLLALLVFNGTIARADGPLPVIDLTKKFANADFNTFEDNTYADGATLIVPAPATKDDEYMVSIEEQGEAGCWVTGVRNKKGDDGTTEYFAFVRVQHLGEGNGRCIVGVSWKTTGGVKKAFLTFFSQGS